jgi:hypothetical protein
MVPTGLVHRDLPVDLVTDVPSKGNRSFTINIGLLGLQCNAVDVCDGHDGSKLGGADVRQRGGRRHPLPYFRNPSRAHVGLLFFDRYQQDLRFGKRNEPLERIVVSRSQRSARVQP